MSKLFIGVSRCPFCLPTISRRHLRTPAVNLGIRSAVTILVIILNVYTVVRQTTGLPDEHGGILMMADRWSTLVRHFVFYVYELYRSDT